MSLPRRGLLDRQVHNQRGTVHQTWTWPTNAGKANLVVEVLAWDGVQVSLFVTYPGIQRRTAMVYRDITIPEYVTTTVEHALRSLGR